MLCVSKIKKRFILNKISLFILFGEKLVSIILNLMKTKFKEKKTPRKLERSLRKRKRNAFTELINAQI